MHTLWLFIRKKFTGTKTNSLQSVVMENVVYHLSILNFHSHDVLSNMPENPGMLYINVAKSFP